jgi:hypothetical protein
MLTVASRTVSAADAGVAATTISHVSIQVSDLKRSVDFYNADDVIHGLDVKEPVSDSISGVGQALALTAADDGSCWPRQLNLRFGFWAM